MSLGRDGSNDGVDSDTPPTRSYIDALLGGNLSESELANLRAEIGRGDAQPGDDDDGGARTRFHMYSAEERQSSRPSGYLQAVKPDVVPIVESDDDDEGGARTLFHTYSAQERQSSRPSGYLQAVKPDVVPIVEGAAPPMSDDDDEAPTLYRPSSRPAPPSVAPSTPPSTSTRPAPSVWPRTPSTRPVSQPPSSRPRTAGYSGYAASSHAAPSSPPSSRPRTPPRSSREQPLVDLGDLLADEIPKPPESSPVPSQREVQLSVPSLRTLDPRLAEDGYLEAMGGPNSVPRIAVSPGELRCLPLGAQAGFLVSCIDGVSTVDDIIDISGQSRRDTLRILYDLVQQGAVEIVQR